MPNLPNIKREILKYVFESEGGAANLREFAEQEGYSEHRVANKVGEMGDILDWGISPMHPWLMYGKEDVAKERLREWQSHEPAVEDSERDTDD